MEEMKELETMNETELAVSENTDVQVYESESDDEVIGNGHSGLGLKILGGLVLTGLTYAGLKKAKSDI